MVTTFISSSRLGGTICAERTAIVKAVVQSSYVLEADGDRLKDTQSLLQLALPRTIHVHTEANFSDVSPAAAPCGICRQVYIPATMV
jgi:cytidine deaminase